MQVESPLSDIKGVGPRLQLILDRLGLGTVADLLQYYPRRYDDYTVITPISKLKPGKVSIKGVIKQARGRYVRGGLHITEAVVSDDSDSVKVVWFNQPYRAASIKPNTEYYISGLFELRSGRLSITNPAIESVSDFPLSAGRIVPVYKETKGLTSHKIRVLLKQVFNANIKIVESLPSNIKAKYDLISRAHATIQKHFPDSADMLAQANRRLGFEELFELILASQFAKREIGTFKAIEQPFNQDVAKQFVEHLPFKLTDAQRKVIWQLYKDMDSTKPMNRLLEGDVGAGKTVVAAMAALMVLHNNCSVALLAPTELLARQHADTLYRLLEPLGMSQAVVLLTGKMTTKQKKTAAAASMASGATFLIGTHALLEDKINLSNLGLIIVDEQHRFGVDQRKKLLKKSSKAPHMLSMTATPIPRSLALTIFGELDISVLDEKPAGRQPVATTLVHPTDRDKLYAELEQKLANGEQMFVVCPLIEESDFLKAKSAEKTYEQLSKRFKKHNVKLLHGKKSSADKQAIMESFVNGSTNILVSTTVIEVGVDVPGASIMMIEAPERFGLAQLHQLRGRVGRGTTPGTCYLMLTESNAVSRRLKAIASTSDGFKLAQLDLEIRGAGALYGRSQHGILDLRIADFTDSRLIAEARTAALGFMKNPDNLVQYTYIKRRISELQSVVHLN